jgi:Zn-dependent protease
MKSEHVDYLTSFLLFLPILTIHEVAHAWVAHKCADDTAKDEGRISLNPHVHVDIIGTVIMTLVNMIAGGWLIGWGKPVPVNLENFRRHRFYDNLVALAGPASNIVVAALALVVYRIGNAMGSEIVTKVTWELAQVSVYLTFFNLIPVPPLDGSRILRNAIRINEEIYARFYAFGFVLLIVLVQVPAGGAHPAVADRGDDGRPIVGGLSRVWRQWRLS